MSSCGTSSMPKTIDGENVMRGARIYLGLVGIITLLFGLGYLFGPAKMLEPMGFPSLPGSAMTDIRATYGGTQLGVGLFMLYCLAQERVRIGLVLSVMLVSVGFARTLGLMIDGDMTPALQFATGLELGLSTIAAVLLARLPRVAAP
jgi:hypothetical protein